ncbi:hypothetical protein F5880DRAFT_1316272 [Lentinula raphanica]|nr:hypothetical protein F5880DRAFT_1316272 [Lentinula raphanica]
MTSALPICFIFLHVSPLAYRLNSSYVHTSKESTFWAFRILRYCYHHLPSTFTSELTADFALTLSFSIRCSFARQTRPSHFPVRFDTSNAKQE